LNGDWKKWEIKRLFGLFVRNVLDAVKKNFKLRKKSRLRFQLAIHEFEKTQGEGKACVRPKLTQYLCANCSGSGLIPSSSHPPADSENYPHVAIIGAGIGGVALAVACLHRGIPFTLYERDSSFDARAQGYGLTLQQASNAIKGLGLFSLKDGSSSLLDSATVFQTVNGHERIYVMPYALDSVMWQFSFPMPEEEAKALSARGAQALKKEACHRAQWHKPIPQILSATLPTQISGYPVYDRELLKLELLEKAGAVTLIGDAAHPMSPFKGQGANQALLDALALAREISIACTPRSKWREPGLREVALTGFEEEILARSASKVKDSADAAKFLHSKCVLREGAGPKERFLRKKDDSFEVSDFSQKDL
jgi:hypothetical protein